MRTLLLASLILSSCSKDVEPLPPPPVKAAPKPVAPKPLTGSWRGDFFYVKGKGLEERAQLRLVVLGGVLRLTAVDLPLGTQLEVAGVQYELKKEYDHVGLALPLDRYLADAPWDDLKERKKQGERWPSLPKADWKLTAKLRVPGFEPLETAIPPFDVTGGLDALFTELARTDRTWPDEVKVSAPPAAAWAFNAFEALGDAEKTRDVRLVVLGEVLKNPRTRRCTGYMGARDFTATSYDVELSLVDRVTKQPVATKRFAGQAVCPRNVVVTVGQTPSHAEGPDFQAMRAWVVSQLKPVAKKLE